MVGAATLSRLMLEGIQTGLTDGGTRIQVGLTRDEVKALAGKV